MATLIKIFILLALLFASTFVLLKAFGVLTLAQIEGWLNTAAEMSPLSVAVIITSLLFADLFVAMPTLTLCILSGYFLGFSNGSLAALTGLMLAGICGYSLSRLYGDLLLNRIARDKQQIAEAKELFQQHGFLMILIARAMPIFPEISACLSGITRMQFTRFFIAWTLSTVPYCLIGAYAGSISTASDPMPAIYIAIMLAGTLWAAWFLFYRHIRGKRA